MALAAGTRIGPYEVVAQIGAGGMGEVYQAADTHLKRQVAIKVLPDGVATDPERLARFQREAEVLAALNHPNIAHIHGLEKAAGVTALVMELVEGPTLADRIAQGPIPIDEALPIAAQIANALDAAHERGIVHRDLKPANVKVRDDGTVKVLDFGLAKALEPAGQAAPANVSRLPTITTPAMTQAGVILGTAAYMSPEQARGKPVDARTDIWAFACVLLEMLTGRRAFEDEDVSMTLSKVLQREPDLDALPDRVPTHVRQTLRVCLRKDPAERMSDIRDVRLALAGAFETSAPPVAHAVLGARPVWRRSRPAAAAAGIAALITGLAAWSVRPADETRTVSRFEHSFAAGLQFRNSGREVIAFSRDGRRIVYNTARGLYLRNLDDLEAHVIPGTEGSLTSPFFSPDGQSVGYWQSGELKRVAVVGGAPVVIGPAPENPFGVSWERDNTILFGQEKGVMRVPASGGTPALVIPAQDGEQVYGARLLPDGDSVLFSVTTLRGISRWDGGQVVVQSLRSGRREVVLPGGSDARYVPTGHLVYALKDGLFAVPFDAEGHRVTGTPASVAQGIMRAAAPAAGTAAANYDVSENGTLVYLTSVSNAAQATLTWVSRDGRETPLSTAAVVQPRNPRLSPDGERLAVIVAEDLWVYDIGGRPPIRLTADTDYYSPLWTPDGKSLVYESGAPTSAIFLLPADGSTAAGQVVSPTGHFHPYGWSPDGRELVGVRIGTPGTGNDIVRWPLQQTDGIQPVVATPASEGFAGAMVSPDGRWLAYVSDQTGQREIWVRPLLGPGAAVRVSPNGGIEPIWARNGRELYYLEGTQLVAVRVTAGDRFDFSPPTRLLAYTYVLSSQPPSYDVAPDGRFLMLKPLAGSTEFTPPRIVVTINWLEELKRLAPAN